MTINHAFNVSPRSLTFVWDASLKAYPTHRIELTNDGWKDVLIDDVAISGNFSLSGEVKKVIKPKETIKVYLRVASGSADDEIGRVTLSTSQQVIARIDLKQIGNAESIVNPDEAVLNVELFTDIAATTAYDNASIIRSAGHTELGHGAAFYTNDALAQTLGATGNYPSCVAQSADGQYWRLLPKGNVLMVGDTGVRPTTEQDDSVNHQPKVQEIVDYGKAIGIHDIKFDSGHYSMWVEELVEGTLDAGQNHVMGSNPSGYMLLVDMRAKFIAGEGRTILNRRKKNGGDPNVFDAEWDVLSTGVPHRGGGITIRGHDLNSNTPYKERNCLWLQGDWTINGGIDASDNPALKTNGTQYVLDNEGKGWDIYDKGIATVNDQENGEWNLHGDILIKGFRGELLYSGGPDNGGVRQTGILTMMDTDGNGFNPAPRQVSWSEAAIGPAEEQGGVWCDHLRMINCFQSAEGLFNTGVLKLVEVIGCHKGWSAAGREPLLANIDGLTPLNEGPGLVIENMVVTNALWDVTFNTDTYVKNLTLVDSFCSIGQYNVSADNVRIDNIHYICHSRNMDPVVMFVARTTDGGADTKKCSVGHIHISLTQYAKDNGHFVSRAVREDAGESGSASFDGCFVEKITGEWQSYPIAVNEPAGMHVGIYDQKRDFDHYAKGAELVLTQDEQELPFRYAVTLTNDVIDGGFQSSGTVKVMLPQNPQLLVPNGSKMLIACAVEAGQVVEIMGNGNGFRRFFLLPGESILMEHRDSYWYPVGDPRLVLVRDANIDPGQLALGAYTTVSGVSVANAEFGMTPKVYIWPHGLAGLDVAGECQFGNDGLMDIHFHYQYGVNDPRPAGNLYLNIVLGYPD